MLRRPLDSEWLLANHLNSVVLVALIVLLDVRLGHQLLTATAESAWTSLQSQGCHVEKPEPARGHLAAPKACLSFQLILYILYYRYF